MSQEGTRPKRWENERGPLAQSGGSNKEKNKYKIIIRKKKRGIKGHESRRPARAQRERRRATMKNPEEATPEAPPEKEIQRR